MVDQASQVYQSAEENGKLQQAAEELNTATGKDYSLEPSRSLASAIRKLESLEDEVLTEAIPLRRQGRTLYASVTVNGKYDKEMVVDSGASLILLPGPVAKELGVEPTKQDPMVQLVMADGRTITGQLIKLDEVRVGQFTVKDVEAAVLGPDAVAAEPLLGMSFLGNFKFELDAKAGSLTLVDVEGANPAEETKPGRGRR
nr:retropepsin-like aspartic protease [Aeoliella straminimaris]